VVRSGARLIVGHLDEDGRVGQPRLLNTCADVGCACLLGTTRWCLRAHVGVWAHTWASGGTGGLSRRMSRTGTRQESPRQTVRANG